MFEYKQVKYNPAILPQMGKDSWELVSIYDDKMFFKKKVTQTRTTKEHKTFPEWEEFIKEYKTINNKGVYDKTLIIKYREALKEMNHDQHMAKLKEYKEHLNIYTTKPPLQVSTYLGKQKRYLDTYETVKVNYQDKWQSEMLNSMDVPYNLHEVIMLERDKWQATNPTKEVTTSTFSQMINKYYKKGQNK